jgi:wyosine [tRNA(Phe)-imidazoG37] synthetase (radical SAM superfamily)
MPSHEDVKALASSIAVMTGYNIIEESKDSRVVLLSQKLSSPQRFN